MFDKNSFDYLQVVACAIMIGLVGGSLGALIPGPYAPPAPKHHGDPYKIPPRPFAYAYGVSDEYAGTNFDKKETQDAAGVVTGEYRVALPDGRTQIVTYTADHHNGFIADVKYEGKAHYAAAPAHGPKYHPAPIHKPIPHPAPYHPAPAPYHPAPHPHHG